VAGENVAPEAVTGGVRTLLRLEGLAVFAVALGAYLWLGSEPWWLFLVLLLVPDVSFLGYLGGPRVGALTYNAAHSTIGPIALLAAGALTDSGLVVSLALIWAAHIGLDRAIGYGLKYGAGFGFTHLGRIGGR
jgi:hypothetical protein